MRYFDNNATTPLSPAARTAWLEVQERYWANPSSATQAAARARNFLGTCRERLAGLFGVAPARIVFTSGATEGNNALIGEVARRAKGDAPIYLSPLEHPSVVEPARRWFGAERMEYLPIDAEGRVLAEGLQAALQVRRPAMVSVLAASNETGVLQPWQELAAHCRQAGVVFHCDAVQWIGKKPLEGSTATGFLTGSAHKFGGPKGAGFVLLGEGMEGWRGQLGGGQEEDRRSGTEDLAGIAAMVAALEERTASGLTGTTAGRDAFVERMKTRGGRILSEGAERLSNTVAMIQPRYDRLRWISRLERKGFLIGTGAACSTGKEGPSPTLTALGVGTDEARRALRVSASPDAPMADWIALADALAEVEAELDEDSGQERTATVIEI